MEKMVILQDKDIIVMVGHLINNDQLTEFQITLADMNISGHLDIMDIIQAAETIYGRGGISEQQFLKIKKQVTRHTYRRTRNTITDEEIISLLIGYQNESSAYEETDLSEATNNVNDSFVYRRGSNPKVLITAPHAQWHYRHECPGSDPWCTYSYDFCEFNSECGKPEDYCTGAFAKVLSDLTGAQLLYTKYRSDDPNYYHYVNGDYYQTPIYGTIIDELIPFKQKIYDISRINNPNKFKFVLDLHGTSNDNIGDMDMGYCGGFPETCSLITNTGETIPNLIIDTMSEFGINNICENCVYTGMVSDTVINFTSQQLGVDAIQLEIERSWRCCSESSDYCTETDWSNVISMIRALEKVIKKIDKSYSRINPVPFNINP